PDYAQRLPQDRYATKAYLIDVDLEYATQVKHLNLSALAVLVGRLGERDIILSYSIADGYAAFKSLQALGDALSIQVATPLATKLHWRL
ncbi:hypothetical protein, partial [Salmonella enterica]|uniref:hypothetical protein n=1 Tax=Salmonella enterica TaxID=28901 RepID=UPI0021B19834